MTRQLTRESIEAAETMSPQSAGLTRELLDGPGFAPGDEVAGYQVIDVRGRGGFGQVYRALHVASGRPVALKVLHRFLVNTPSVARRFRLEARTVNAVRHANIVELLELGELVDQRPFLVLEWLDGRTLAEELQSRGAFTPDEARAVIAALASALGAAHRIGVIHRDVKASNVMMMPRAGWFDIKLIDFGIAKLLDPDNPLGSGLTSTASHLGTPHNMAPEQIQCRTIDGRTDVYALGVLLFQLLTGRFPFDARSSVEVEEMHLSMPPPSPSEIAPVPASIDPVVLRCMAKNPADRFQTVEDVVHALDRALDEAAAGVATTTSSSHRAVSRAAGVACHVVARPACGDEEIDDDVFDAMELSLEEARRHLEAAGLEIVREHGTALLGAALLPSDPVLAKKMRQRIREAARRLAAALDGARLDPRMDVAITVHCDDVLVSRSDDKLLGGPLLETPAWPVRPARGVLVTVAALDGLLDS
jgi:tRNA A-37 threonylcarbamoyl transferase component Bud32